MTVREINDYLVKEGYIITISGAPLLTNKYFRDILKSDETVVLLPTVQDMKVVKAQQKAFTQAAAKELMKQFAEDAYVPYRVSDGRGGNYTVKTFSEQGVRAFMRVLEKIEKKEVDGKVLAACTRLYYIKGSYKKTLSNYFIEDVWEGEYSEFKKSMESGKIERHISDGIGGEKNTLDL